MDKKYVVRLKNAECEQLIQIVRKLTGSSQKNRRSQPHVASAADQNRSLLRQRVNHRIEVADKLMFISQPHSLNKQVVSFHLANLKVVLPKISINHARNE